MPSAILARRQIWLAQVYLPETIRKELTNMPVVPGRVFHSDSQSLLDTADQERHRKESVQQTFGHLNLLDMAIELPNPFSPHTFLVQNVGGMREDKLGFTNPIIEAPGNLNKLPKLTSHMLQLGEDL